MIWSRTDSIKCYIFLVVSGWFPLKARIKSGTAVLLYCLIDNKVLISWIKWVSFITIKVMATHWLLYHLDTSLHYFILNYWLCHAVDTRKCDVIISSIKILGVHQFSLLGVYTISLCHLTELQYHIDSAARHYITPHDIWYSFCHIESVMGRALWCWW